MNMVSVLKNLKQFDDITDKDNPEKMIYVKDLFEAMTEWINSGAFVMTDFVNGYVKGKDIPTNIIIRIQHDWIRNFLGIKDTNSDEDLI